MCVKREKAGYIMGSLLVSKTNIARQGEFRPNFCGCAKRA